MSRPVPSDSVQNEKVCPAAQSIYGDELVAFFETLTLASFRQREVSVTLCRPRDPDCPLIGVSDGFERLTGYPRAEIVGRNCRFLNQGCVVSAADRHAMRICLRTGQSFTGVLQNRRKNGELFSNLLTMRTLRIGTTPYIIGVQVDVTNMEVDLASEKTATELTALVDAIFNSNVEAWAKRQATYWITQKNQQGIHRPLYPLAEVLDSASKQPAENYEQARNAFVSVEASLDQNSLKISNTFWEVYDVHDDLKAKQTELRMVMSEPNLGTGTWKGLLDQSPHAPSQDSLPLFYNAMNARPLVPLTKLASSTDQSRAARPPVLLGELALSTEQCREAAMATSPAMSRLPVCTPSPQYHNNYAEAFEPSAKQASCRTLGIKPLADDIASLLTSADSIPEVKGAAGTGRIQCCPSEALSTKTEVGSKSDFSEQHGVVQGRIAEKTLDTAVANLASPGSTNHPVDCKPCAFFCYSLMGCERGSECTFCHMEHPRRIRCRGRRRKIKGEREEDHQIDFPVGFDKISAAK
jgi:PAS domain S-box-containing protein